jgi:hypothetical protein
MSSTISSLGDLEESLIAERVVKTIAKDGVKIEKEKEENTSNLCKLNGKTMWKLGELFVDDVVRIITRISVHNLNPCSRTVVTGVT